MQTTNKTQSTSQSISEVLGTAAFYALYPLLLIIAGVYRLVRRFVRSRWDDGNIHDLPLERRLKVMRMLDMHRRVSYALVELDNLIARRGDDERDVLERLRRSARMDYKKLHRWLQFRHFINKGDVVKISEREAQLFQSRYC